MVLAAAVLTLRGALSSGKPHGGVRSLAPAAYERDCKNLTLLEERQDDLCDDAFVQHLDHGNIIVDVDVIDASPRRLGQPEGLATLPGPISVDLPNSFEPAQTVAVRGGPHYRSLDVQLPKWVKPGQKKLDLYLGPRAELLIEVPRGKKAGDQVNIMRKDNSRLIVDIPDGKGPGSVFEYTPSVLMVSVPEGSCAGEFVVFRHHRCLESGETETNYCRAQVPEELLFGRYFAARVPTLSRLNKDEGKDVWLPLLLGRQCQTRGQEKQKEQRSVITRVSL